jgi:hypothetical protein
MKARKILTVAGSRAVTTERARVAAKIIKASRSSGEVRTITTEKYLGHFGASERVVSSHSGRKAKTGR